MKIFSTLALTLIFLPQLSLADNVCSNIDGQLTGTFTFSGNAPEAGPYTCTYAAYGVGEMEGNSQFIINAQINQGSSTNPKVDCGANPEVFKGTCSDGEIHIPWGSQDLSGAVTSAQLLASDNNTTLMLEKKTA